MQMVPGYILFDLDQGQRSNKVCLVNGISKLLDLATINVAGAFVP